MSFIINSSIDITFEGCPDHTLDSILNSGRRDQTACSDCLIEEFSEILKESKTVAGKDDIEMDSTELEFSVKENERNINTLDIIEIDDICLSDLNSTKNFELAIHPEINDMSLISSITNDTLSFDLLSNPSKKSHSFFGKPYNSFNNVSQNQQSPQPIWSEHSSSFEIETSSTKEKKENFNDTSSFFTLFNKSKEFNFFELQQQKEINDYEEKFETIIDWENEIKKFVQNSGKTSILCPNISYTFNRIDKNKNIPSIDDLLKTLDNFEKQQCEKSANFSIKLYENNTFKNITNSLPIKRVLLEEEISDEEQFIPMACSTPKRQIKHARNSKNTEITDDEQQQVQQKDDPDQNESVNLFAGLISVADLMPSNENNENKKEIGHDLDNFAHISLLIPEVIINEYSPNVSFVIKNDLLSLSVIRSPYTKDKKRREELIKKIEEIILSLLLDLSTGNELKFVIKNQTKWCNSEFVNERLTMKQTNNMIMKEIKFINQTTSNRRFTLIMYLLGEVHKFLLTKTTCTKRELYYRNVELAENQTNLNWAIRDLCCLLEAAPWELGILATSKGLVVGSLEMTTINDEVINCRNTSGGVLLPNDISGAIKTITTKAEFILIVEKDTVYRKLIQEDIFKRMDKELILITAKGIPDVNTRVLLKRLWDEFQLPIYALVDADPFGIEIMFIYRYGSLAMSQNADALAVPSIRWIGIHPSDIEMLQIPSIPMKAADFARLQDIMKRPYVNDKISDELIILKENKVKAEIEGLYDFSNNYLSDEYIPYKIKNELAI